MLADPDSLALGINPYRTVVVGVAIAPIRRREGALDVRLLAGEHSHCLPFIHPDDHTKVLSVLEVFAA